ncbi:hypothetical protein NRIC_32010 [Enterococcus florum]|uniref:WxL domain-containing protein n=1 Tax=Enterococcus florum TaxID=2480627 RepID=A0A4P5PBB6_9ENTE|nr:hypothetical protein [Enterococcus florum]GCF95310.1 hypothetical protein NRIC_32010 [Enterococcus florum]
MKKIVSTMLLATLVLGAAPLAFAQDGTAPERQNNVNGQGSAEIEVNGTLGADNKDPDATIPEEDVNWINVTVPTKTIFYNTADDPAIKAPTYNIVNHSGRPVTVTANGFEAGEDNSVLPEDFDLNLAVSGNNVTTATTSLIAGGQLAENLNSELITLANNENHLTVDGAAGESAATFTYTGTATVEEQLELTYTLNLKFDAVSWN